MNLEAETPEMRQDEVIPRLFALRYQFFVLRGIFLFHPLCKGFLSLFAFKIRKRGMKTLTVPAHNRATCHDMVIRCVKFVLPEDLDVSGDTDFICDTRKFCARLIARYIDNDFKCCECESEV